jgi:hypothetical protein
LRGLAQHHRSEALSPFRELGKHHFRDRKVLARPVNRILFHSFTTEPRRSLDRNLCDFPKLCKTSVIFHHCLETTFGSTKYFRTLVPLWSALAFSLTLRDASPIPINFTPTVALVKLLAHPPKAAVTTNKARPASTKISPQDSQGSLKTHKESPPL